MIFGTATLALYKDADYVRNPQTGEILESCVDRICQNILANLAPGLLNNFVGSLLVVSTIPSYILILTPVREHMEAPLLRYWQQIVPYSASGSLMEDIGRNMIRTALVIGTAVIATQDPNFGSTLGAVGGLTDAFQAFIVPIIIFFYVRISTSPKESNNSSSSSPSSLSASRQLQQQLPWTQRVFYCTVCGWGASIMFYTFTGVLLGEAIHINYFVTTLFVSTLVLTFMYEMIIWRVVCKGGKHYQHQQPKILSSHVSGDLGMLDVSAATNTTCSISPNIV